jgi:replicative DNA helicase
LKALAKELNIPIIALSQLSRAVETRGGEKKPILSDLRESGGIEQDADIVIFLYRPEYYGFDTDPDGLPNKGIGYFNIAKHRNGELKEIRVGFDGKFTKFKNLHEMEAIENHNRASEMQSGISPAMKKYVQRREVEPKDSQAEQSNADSGAATTDPEDDQPF